MRLWSSCDTGSKEIGIPRQDVTSKSESTSQYAPAKISARSTSMRTRMTEGNVAPVRASRV